MVLQKRKADGSFQDWNPESSSSTSTRSSSRKKQKTASETSSSAAANAIISTSRVATSDRYLNSSFTEVSNGYMASAYTSTSTGSHYNLSSSYGSQPNPTSSQPVASSSQTLSSSPYTPLTASTSKAKKTSRKTKAKDTMGTPEKRKAQYKSRCPKNIQDRLERYISQSQRILLMDRQREEGQYREVFTIQGSVGNVYTVTIEEIPHCSCPDHLKGNHCKHILFIFLKVLQVPRESDLWYQKALLSSELKEIFDQAPPPPQLRQQLRSIHANDRVVGAWRERTGRGPTPSESTDSGSTSTGSKAKDHRRIPDAEDDCPICYDKMNEDGIGVGGDKVEDSEKAKEEELEAAYRQLEKILDWCVSCGNAVHKECWGTWKTTNARQGKQLTCVWCRAQWVTTSTASFSSGSASGRLVGDEGYINVANVPGSGVSPVRDTSTYYHGRIRGQRGYGYSDYR